MPNQQSYPRKGEERYRSVITREQFLFYEMRTTARLRAEGLSDAEVTDRIVEENLFQYPTERSVRRMARTCLQRLNALEDESLTRAIATQPGYVARQICLYAMMRQYRLVWDFMVTVVGAKYRELDSSFSRADITGFLMRLQEQDNDVAQWSDKTLDKIRLVLQNILVENEYLDSRNANRLNPVLLSPMLENAIRANSDELALPAFNCFG